MAKTREALYGICRCELYRAEATGKYGVTITDIDTDVVMFDSGGVYASDHGAITATTTKLAAMQAAVFALHDRGG